MQQTGGEHGTGRAHLRKNRGHSHRVGDVRVATLTLLTLVAAVRHLVGTLQHLNVLIRVVAAHGTHDRRNHRGETDGTAVRIGRLHLAAAATEDQAVRHTSASSHDAVRAANSLTLLRLLALSVCVHSGFCTHFQAPLDVTAMT